MEMIVTTVRLPARLDALLTQQAEREHRSKHSILLTAIEAALLAAEQRWQRDQRRRRDEEALWKPTA